MQLWVVVENKHVNAALITQIKPYPQKKVLSLKSLAGEDFQEIKGFLEMVEVFALKNGCSSLEMWGRKGWKKLLSDWKDSYIVYTKDLKTRMQ